LSSLPVLIQVNVPVPSNGDFIVTPTKVGVIGAVGIVMVVVDETREGFQANFPLTLRQTSGRRAVPESAPAFLHDVPAELAATAEIGMATNRRAAHTAIREEVLVTIKKRYSPTSLKLLYSQLPR
jgi:hypothetical protein